MNPCAICISTTAGGGSDVCSAFTGDPSPARRRQPLHDRSSRTQNARSGALVASGCRTGAPPCGGLSLFGTAAHPGHPPLGTPPVVALAGPGRTRSAVSTTRCDSLLPDPRASEFRAVAHGARKVVLLTVLALVALTLGGCTGHPPAALPIQTVARQLARPGTTSVIVFVPGRSHSTAATAGTRRPAADQRFRGRERDKDVHASRAAVRRREEDPRDWSWRPTAVIVRNSERATTRRVRWPGRRGW